MPETQHRKLLGQVAAGALLVVVIIVGMAMFFAIPACEEKLADTGEVVEVCRLMTITDLPVIIVGIVILALLTVFFTEVSGFGVTLKRAVNEAKDSADKAKTAADEAVNAVQSLEVSLSQRLDAVQNATLTANVPVTVTNLVDRIEHAPEETTFGMYELEPVIQLTDALREDLTSPEYRNNWQVPIDLTEALSLVDKARRGQPLDKYEAQALIYSIYRTMSAYETQLSRRTQSVFAAVRAAVEQLADEA